MNTSMILPIVHRNGTSRDALIEQRCTLGIAIREAQHALTEMVPNGRDYYPERGRFEAAMAQHGRRAELLRDLLAEISAEAEAIADL